MLLGISVVGRPYSDRLCPGASMQAAHHLLARNFGHRTVFVRSAVVNEQPIVLFEHSGGKYYISDEPFHFKIGLWLENRFASNFQHASGIVFHQQHGAAAVGADLANHFGQPIAVINFEPTIIDRNRRRAGPDAASLPITGPGKKITVRSPMQAIRRACEPHFRPTKPRAAKRTMQRHVPIVDLLRKQHDVFVLWAEDYSVSLKRLKIGG